MIDLSLKPVCLDSRLFFQLFSPPNLSPLPHFLSPPFSLSNYRKRKLKAQRAMSDDNSTVVADDLRSFKLTESTFLSALMPKTEIGADRFIEAHPEYDGRGAVIAIFDSGVDPAAAGLQLTSDGKPKILDILDCTGSGDVDTSKVVNADADGHIRGASGALLAVNPSWTNPSGEWRVGYKLVYEFFTDTLTSRLKKERKKKWDEKNQEAIAEAVKQLSEFDQVERHLLEPLFGIGTLGITFLGMPFGAPYRCAEIWDPSVERFDMFDRCVEKYSKVEEFNLKKAREDLQNRVDFLQRQADSYDDKGPVIDAVVWNDGDVWRVALDIQSLEDDPECGKLADFSPLTNYRAERKYGIFSKLDACSFVANVYNEGNILSIVTDCSPHGTHVAGIATAFHAKEPLLNGIAPGAQLISCKIGDSRLGSMETGTGLTRALIAAVEHKCDLINMSYGEPALLPDYGRFVDLVNEVVDKYRLIFISSAGNSGPALSTVGAPGGTTSSIIGIGAYVSPAMAAAAHCVVEPPCEGLEYTWSSRGPTVDGDLGVCISAPGGAVAPVPTWTLQRRMLMNGTSMASPSACGGVALLISAMKAEGIPVSPYSVRKALENTTVSVGESLEDKLSTGQGLMQVDKAHEYIRQSKKSPCIWYQITTSQAGKSDPTSRGIYLREASACQQTTEWTIQVQPRFHEDASNLEQLVPFEECVKLHTSEKCVVRSPDYLLLTHNGRSFNIVVDPTKLSVGLHYFELYGIDCKAPWRGPLFTVPITITKPIVVNDESPTITFSGMSFVPGHIERRFIKAPIGASWVEANMRTSGFDTARRFFVDTVQICPLKRPIKWESVVTFASPSAKSFAFPVEAGQTIELALAQFWSSGIGSQETTIVDFEGKGQCTAGTKAMTPGIGQGMPSSGTGMPLQQLTPTIEAGREYNKREGSWIPSPDSDTPRTPLDIEATLKGGGRSRLGASTSPAEGLLISMRPTTKSEDVGVIPERAIVLDPLPHQRVRRGVSQRVFTLCGSLTKSDANSMGIKEYWKKYALFCTRVEAQGKGLILSHCIIHRIGDNAYELDIPGIRSKVVNVKLLTQFYGDIPSHPMLPSPPSPEITDEIDEILDSRVDVVGHVEFLIRWVGRLEEDDSWISGDSFARIDPTFYDDYMRLQNSWSNSS
ncbi:hypothetical protein GIB67_008349 [Kingdonia uniflora]|uniref:tripeptidyl-peptidase II n=1 Tax=Kingdonia uniflora TaxID=39325 RepID=A0A7J7N5D0_9MAGN|nr:hypothetical protein GIB67_008349 [Kingdonia uniflora]